jgi:hypothetical protein
MKFYYDNLVDKQSVAITASTENAALPVTNLANSLRKRVYQTGSEWTTSITVDLVFARTVSDVILLDVSAGDNVPDLNIFSSPDGSTWTSRYSGAFAGGGTQTATFAAFSARYWKIELSRDSDTSPITVGRLFMGQPYTTTEPPDYDGVTFTPNDPSNIVVSSGGQEYTDLKEHF